MTSKLLRTSAFAFAAAALVGVSLSAAPPAAPPAPPGAAPPGSANTADLPHPLRASQIIGSTINMKNNTEIGTVSDIVLTDSGEVEYLVVKRSDGMFVTVPWQAAMWGTDYKTATVNVTPEQLKVVPTYNATNYPQWFTPTYRSEVYKYYGLTPGQLRRLNRRLP